MLLYLKYIIVKAAYDWIQKQQRVTLTQMIGCPLNH